MIGYVVEVGWLIEAPNLMWWTGDGWTFDSLQAVRFARRQDAEKMIKVQGLDGRFAVEHEWHRQVFSDD